MNARRYFEYHCYEGEDSADAELWHHTHQYVHVLCQLADRDVDVQMYKVAFEDGLEYDVFGDELLAGPDEGYRPDYIQVCGNASLRFL